METCDRSAWELRPLFAQFYRHIFDISILIAVSGSVCTWSLEAFPPGGPAPKCLSYVKSHLLSGSETPKRLIRKCCVFFVKLIFISFMEERRERPVSHILRRERFVSSCCKNANLIRGCTHFLRNAQNKHAKPLNLLLLPFNSLPLLFSRPAQEFPGTLPEPRIVLTNAFTSYPFE